MMKNHCCVMFEEIVRCCGEEGRNFLLIGVDDDRDDDGLRSINKMQVVAAFAEDVC